MREEPSDDRSPMTVAIGLSARITTIGLEMALPAGGGYWLDTRYHTSPILTVVGAILGFVVGFNHLLKLARQNEKKP